MFEDISCDDSSYSHHVTSTSSQISHASTNQKTPAPTQHQQAPATKSIPKNCTVEAVTSANVNCNNNNQHSNNGSTTHSNTSQSRDTAAHERTLQDSTHTDVTTRTVGAVE